MNNIIFSKLTRRQIIDLYNNKEYKKTIELVRSVFANRRIFKEYLDKYGQTNILSNLDKLYEILYMWTVRDEFKAFLNGNIEILTINYFDALKCDYITAFFDNEQIRLLKEECKKYYYKRVNELLVNNYESGNFDYVVDSLKHDYKSHANFEKKIGIKCSGDYEKKQLSSLREISHIYGNMDLSKSRNNITNYYYGFLNNLLSIYGNQDIEYVLRYLYRQNKIGVSLTELFNNKELLSLFNENDYNTLIKIYNEHIKNGLKVVTKGGYGLYGANEYVNALHIVMTILEIPGTLEEKFDKIKNDYNYTVKDLKIAMLSNLPKKVLNKSSFSKFNQIYNCYKKYVEDIEKRCLKERKEKQISNIVDLIESLLADNVNIDNYFNQSTILKKEFKKILKFMEENCPELYLRYVNDKTERVKIASNAVVEKLKNNKKFDEVDYYMTTRVSYRDIREYLINVDLNDYILFSEYINSNINQMVLGKNKLDYYCNNKQVITISNADGTLEVFEPTKEEKIAIISFLNSIGAPLTAKNIDCALKKYYKGELNKTNKGQEKKLRYNS